MITLAEAEATQQLISQARLEIIPGAGHAANIDEPERFTRTVVSFLEE